jgi:hypothetical protein
VRHGSWSPPGLRYLWRRCDKPAHCAPLSQRPVRPIPPGLFHPNGAPGRPGLRRPLGEMGLTGFVGSRLRWAGDVGAAIVLRCPWERPCS